MTQVRTPAKSYDADGNHVGPGPWLDVVRAANGIAPGMFGSPYFVGPWWAGGSVEEYAEARVIHRDDGSVSIVGKSVTAERVLAQAANEVGL
jgi:hypothetical protein